MPPLSEDTTLTVTTTTSSATLVHHHNHVVDDVDDVVDSQEDDDTLPALLALSAKLRNHVIEMKRCRKVSFSKDDHDDDDDDNETTQNKIIEIEPIPVEYRSDYFMTKEEYEQIKYDCSILVSQIKHNNTTTESTTKDDDTTTTTATTSSYCLRGLENNLLTGENFLSNYLHRRGALRAVLKEQTFQKQTGYQDVDDIADAYQEYSSKSLVKAQQKAKEDEQETQSMYLYANNHQ